jgi:hypothetical protein
MQKASQIEFLDIPSKGFVCLFGTSHAASRRRDAKNATEQRAANAKLWLPKRTSATA